MRFHIENMTCGGCARSVTTAILSVDPVAKFNADPARHKVDVTTTAPRPKPEAVLATAGFSVN
ncbi:MAG: heavy metal transport/detoxification protein [Pseudorhodobacter sp. PARRP1]|nr:MAG: heavy metal transport/detoxification protein [Pseudorhodobacter sp. PARRP1]